MLQLLWICLGGALGSGARYLVGLGAVRALGAGFPYGTLIVNVVGSFLLSAVLFLSVETDAVPVAVRLFLTTGLLGGFTTYSSFNAETIELLRSGAWGLGFANVLLTLVACLTAGFLGSFVATRIAAALS